MGKQLINGCFSCQKPNTKGISHFHYSSHYPWCIQLLGGLMTLPPNFNKQLVVDHWKKMNNKKEVTMSNETVQPISTPVTEVPAQSAEALKTKPKKVQSSKSKKGMKKVSKKRLAKIGKKGGKTTKPSSRISKSGKFKSIRHLMENLLAKNKKLTFEKANESVLKEYPDSKFNNVHFSWYKNKIVSHGETKDRS